MTDEAPEKPILITGSHRSGSTWLANMLALTDNTLIAHEPFNIESWAYGLDGLAKHWFTYAPALPQDEALQAFDKVIKQQTRKIFLKNQPQHWFPPLRGGRLIIKDPIASLSSDWISRNFALEVVVLIRHPAAFAASLKRLGWRHPFEHFLEQEMLMQRYLKPYEDELVEKPDDIVRQAGLAWKILYTVLRTHIANNPGWIVKKHETLSTNPVAELKRLYETLGLQWNAAVESKVNEYTQTGNPTDVPGDTVHQMRRDSVANVHRWKKVLTEKETVQLREITHPISDLYYSEEDW